MLNSSISCNLSATTNGYKLTVKVDYDDGSNTDYILNDSYILVSHKYNLPNTYSIRALVKTSNSNFSAYQNISGNIKLILKKEI